MPHLHALRLEFLPNTLNLRVILKRVKRNRVPQKTLLGLQKLFDLLLDVFSEVLLLHQEFAYRLDLEGEKPGDL